MRLHTFSEIYDVARGEVERPSVGLEPHIGGSAQSVVQLPPSNLRRLGIHSLAGLTHLVAIDRRACWVNALRMWPMPRAVWGQREAPSAGSRWRPVTLAAPPLWITDHFRYADVIDQDGDLVARSTQRNFPFPFRRSRRISRRWGRPYGRRYNLGGATLFKTEPAGRGRWRVDGGTPSAGLQHGGSAASPDTIGEEWRVLVGRRELVAPGLDAASAGGRDLDQHTLEEVGVRPPALEAFDRVEPPERPRGVSQLHDLPADAIAAIGEDRAGVGAQIQ